jgi:A/G-specific adenine glycosylase
MTDPVAVGCHDGEMTDPVAVGLRVVAWYRAGHRELPWRATGDPYRILVSEIMLQQTRVETVIGYYERFLQAFPDVAALAGASEEAVMALWQGLGYYSRARNLQKAARQILSRHGGAFPKEPGVLRQLAGIGPYTAGAIASIAFGVPEPAVDGNVLRVAARLGLVAEDILNAATRARITEMVRAMIPPAAAADFTQGMMELGATLCTPVNPACGRCPVRADCAALCAGCVDRLPVRSPKAPPQASNEAVFLVRDPQERLLLVYRHEGLLRGLWGLPHFESEAAEPDLSRLLEMPVIRQAVGKGTMVLRESAGSCRHVFTHRLWQMRIWWVDLLEANNSEEETFGYKWLPEGQLGSVPMPEAFRKVLRVAGLSRKEQRRPGTGKGVEGSGNRKADGEA